MFTAGSPAPPVALTRPAIEGSADTCVCSVAALFDGFLSEVVLATLAELVRVPTEDGVITIVILAVAFFGRFPSWHVTVLVPLQLPWLGVAETNAAAGSGSTTL